MKTACLSVIFGIALLSPGALRAQTPATASKGDAQAAVDAARDQKHEDMKALTADRKAKAAACKTPGAECDAAKAKVKASKEKVRADVDALKSARKALRDSRNSQKSQ